MSNPAAPTSNMACDHASTAPKDNTANANRQQMPTRTIFMACDAPQAALSALLHRPKPSPRSAPGRYHWVRESRKLALGGYLRQSKCPPPGSTAVSREVPACSKWDFGDHRVKILEIQHRFPW